MFHIIRYMKFIITLISGIVIGTITTTIVLLNTMDSQLMQLKANAALTPTTAPDQAMPGTSMELPGNKTYTINDDSGAPLLSFEHPPVGEYCNGCFDGWPSNGPTPDEQGISITGGYNTPDISKRSWRITAGVTTKTSKLSTSLLLPMLNMVEGDVIKTSDEVGRAVEIKYVGPRATNYFDSRVYTFTYEPVVESEFPVREVALIERPTDTIMVSFAKKETATTAFMDILNTVRAE